MNNDIKKNQSKIVENLTLCNIIINTNSTKPIGNELFAINVSKVDILTLKYHCLIINPSKCKAITVGRF